MATTRAVKITYGLVGKLGKRVRRKSTAYKFKVGQRVVIKNHKGTNSWSPVMSQSTGCSGTIIQRRKEKPYGNLYQVTLDDKETFHKLAIYWTYCEIDIRREYKKDRIKTDSNCDLDDLSLGYREDIDE